MDETESEFEQNQMRRFCIGLITAAIITKEAPLNSFAIETMVDRAVHAMKYIEKRVTQMSQEVPGAR